MWFALVPPADFLQPVPTIVRSVPERPKPTVSRPSGIQVAPGQVVTVPVKYETSEKATLLYLEKSVPGLRLVWTGPNYALLDAGVPYGVPVSVDRFLADVARAYKQGYVSGSFKLGPGVVSAENQKP